MLSGFTSAQETPISHEQHEKGPFLKSEPVSYSASALKGSKLTPHGVPLRVQLLELLPTNPHDALPRLDVCTTFEAARELEQVGHHMRVDDDMLVFALVDVQAQILVALQNLAQMLELGKHLPADALHDEALAVGPWARALAATLPEMVWKRSSVLWVKCWGGGREGGTGNVPCQIDVQVLRLPCVDLECVCPLVHAAVLADNCGADERPRNYSGCSDLAPSKDGKTERFEKSLTMSCRICRLLRHDDYLNRSKVCWACCSTRRNDYCRISADAAAEVHVASAREVERLTRRVLQNVLLCFWFHRTPAIFYRHLVILPVLVSFSSYLLLCLRHVYYYGVYKEGFK